MQTRNLARTVLVLGCLGLAGCASAQSQVPLNPAPVPQVQAPVPARPPEAVPVSVPLVPAPVVQAAQPAQYELNTIVVSTPERTLYYLDDSGVWHIYRVGVGSPRAAWSGVQYISAKGENPSWTPPKEMIERELKEKGRVLPTYVKGGARDNPLGARALYLGSTLYRIHGTNDRRSIGGAVSSGCFRMTNEDVKDLYNRVRVGTKVVVLK